MLLIMMKKWNKQLDVGLSYLVHYHMHVAYIQIRKMNYLLCLQTIAPKDDPGYPWISHFLDKCLLWIVQKSSADGRRLVNKINYIIWRTYVSNKEKLMMCNGSGSCKKISNFGLSYFFCKHIDDFSTDVSGFNRELIEYFLIVLIYLSCKSEILEQYFESEGEYTYLRIQFLIFG